MISLIIGFKIAYAFMLHFVADWALQSKEMGREKSNKFSVLLQHAGVHLVVFFFGALIFLNPAQALMFSAANAAVHAIIDWYLWRLYKLSVYHRRDKLIPQEKYEEWGVTPKEMSYQEYIEMLKNKDFTQVSEEMNWLKTEFKFWDDYWFGFTLGFDQMLHAIHISMFVALFLL